MSASPERMPATLDDPPVDVSDPRELLLRYLDDPAPTLGRILFHLFQEYARHGGQLDIARELLDGTVGE
ncbi:DUF664 domain-containing protein [Plantactinospora veratri]|uniref:DUF664 domain-containing protein n=1 Tax=Plantactinospora veratri TaxID=1436122 RepID=A0ABU7SII2_9ACTN